MLVVYILQYLFTYCIAAATAIRYMSAIEEDAVHIEDELRQVWRRYIRNPDERGNPQLTTTLKVNLFTHLSVDTSSSSSSGSEGQPIVATTTTAAAVDSTTPATIEVPATASTTTTAAVTTATTVATTAAADDDNDIGAQCVVSMSPLLVPVVCRIGAQ